MPIRTRQIRTTLTDISNTATVGRTALGNPMAVLQRARLPAVLEREANEEDAGRRNSLANFEV